VECRERVGVDVFGEVDPLGFGVEGYVFEFALKDGAAMGVFFVVIHGVGY